MGVFRRALTLLTGNAGIGQIPQGDLLDPVTLGYDDTVSQLGATTVNDAVVKLAARALTPGLPTRITPGAPSATLSIGTPLAAGETLELDLNGARQWQGLDYTIAGSTVTFTGAGYAAGDVLTYRRLSVK